MFRRSSRSIPYHHDATTTTNTITCNHCTNTTIQAEYSHGRHRPTAHTRGNTYTASCRHYTTTAVTNTYTNTTMQTQCSYNRYDPHSPRTETHTRHRIAITLPQPLQTPIQTQMSPTLHKHNYTNTMQIKPLRPTQPAHGENTYTTLYHHNTTTSVTDTNTNTMIPRLYNTPVQTQYNPDRHSSHSPPTGKTHFRHHVAITQPQLSQTPVQTQCHHPCTTQIYKHDAVKTITINTAHTRGKHTHDSIFAITQP